MAAVSSAADDRQTHYTTAAVRAADGRRTILLWLKTSLHMTLQEVYKRLKGRKVMAFLFCHIGRKT
ncbi:MAG: hypothetical protein HXL35_00990 [Prevotellaceae bacterium]|nr:hypothetical protein [Prevotellaceae bacterium]